MDVVSVVGVLVVGRVGLVGESEVALGVVAGALANDGSVGHFVGVCVDFELSVGEGLLG